MNNQNHIRIFCNILLIVTIFNFVPSAYGQFFTKITTGNLVNDAGSSFGCSWNDYDNDGFLDLFVANYLNQTNFLYQNNHDRTFTRILNNGIVSDDGNSISCSWGDYDNDGDLDIFIANWEQKNALYQNNGDGTFTGVTEGEIVNDEGKSMGCSWADYDNDGYLDLFVTNYVQSNALYHNNGDNTFTKIAAGEIVTDQGFSAGCGWGDYDNDGFVDLYVVNWGRNNFLYHNNGDGTFTKITEGEIVNSRARSLGCSWGDYDNNGYLDLFVTNWDRNNFLYHNNGDGTFTKINGDPIVEDRGFFTNSNWGDYDNDGDLDMFITNWDEDPQQKNMLYRNNGNETFTKIGVGDIVNDEGPSIGSSWGDIDNDGDLDLIVTNDGEVNNFLYLNNGNRNNWTNIKCVGISSNASAIGAKVRVKATINNQSVWQMQEISGQTGYASQNSLNAEFGLKDAALIDSIKVEWPNGLVQVMLDITINQHLTINEPMINLDVPERDVFSGDTVLVPINVQFPEYFTFSSAEIKIGGYSNNLDFLEVVTDTSLSGDHEWIFEVNESDSTVKIWFAGAEDVSGQGVLFWSKFSVTTSNIGFVPINVESSVFDTGLIPVNITSGGLNVMQPSQDITKVMSREATIPSEFTLEQNFPNPFNPSTTIHYSLKQSSIVQLSIYNEMGHLVRNLVNTAQSSGNHSVVWDGRNETGELVSSGMYFYILKVDGNVVRTRRMTLIK
jgi:hypothetical protein